MKKLNDVKIFVKIIGLALVIGLPFILIFAFYFMPLLEENLLQEKEANVKQNVQVAFGIIKESYNEFIRGELTETEAQTRAKALINSNRYENDGYFWINDYNCRIVLHPLKPELNGQNLSNSQDANGKYIWKEFVKSGKQPDGGLVKYYWARVSDAEPELKISYVIGFDEWGWVVGSGIYVNDVQEEIAALESNMLLVLAVLSVLVTLFVFVMGRNISVPLKKLETMAQKVAEGDVSVSVDVERRDEIGVLASAFNKMVVNLKNLLNEVNEKSIVAEKAANDAKEAQMLAEEQQEYLARSAKALLTEMEKFSNGDLTVYVNPEKEGDDISRLFLGFNKSVSKIEEMLLEVSMAVNATASASTEISSAAEEMAAGSQEQSQQASEVAVAVEQMVATISSTSKNASEANEAAGRSGKFAQKGVEKIQETKNGMNKIVVSAKETSNQVSSLTKKTDQIGEITQVINDIADQTNLLALNAAIEAARAGEQGRGFAVVADEVRKLAERTTKATKEISETIKSIQDEVKDVNQSMLGTQIIVEQGLVLTEEVAEVLGEIYREGDSTISLISQVAAASEEQSAASEQINISIDSISTVIQESANSTEQISIATDDLRRLTEKLEFLISKFNVNQNNLNNTYISDETFGLQQSMNDKIVKLN